MLRAFRGSAAPSNIGEANEADRNKIQVFSSLHIGRARPGELRYRHGQPYSNSGFGHGLTGGMRAALGWSTYAGILALGELAGFAVAWPYNAWRLKAYGLACHFRERSGGRHGRLNRRHGSPNRAL